MVTCHAMMASPAGVAWPATSWATPRVKRAVTTSTTMGRDDGAVAESLYGRTCVSPMARRVARCARASARRRCASSVSIFDSDEAAAERARRRPHGAAGRLLDDDPAHDAGGGGARSQGGVDGDVGRRPPDSPPPGAARRFIPRWCLSPLLAPGWTEAAWGVRRPE